MPTRRYGLVLMLAALLVLTACVPVLATGAIRERDATIDSPVATEPPNTNSAIGLTGSDSAVAVLPVNHQNDGDDPVGHVIVFPLVILAAVVLIAATVGIVGLATGHH